MKSVDHTVQIVTDLEAASALMKRLGFHVRPISHHIGAGSANAIIHFQQTYHELIHVSDARCDIADLYLPRLKDGEGLCHVSLTADSLKEEHARLRGLGYAPSDIMGFARKITMPDGSQDETASSSVYNWQAVRPYMSLFFSEHPKPQTIFIPEYADHANGALRLVHLVFMSLNPSADRSYFEASFGGAATPTEPDGFFLTGSRGEQITVLTPEAAALHYQPLLTQPVQIATGGYPIALHYAVSNPAQAREVLQKGSITAHEFAQGVAVAAQDGAGAIMVFEPE